ncbi:MAG: tetratricopeptide repeat protein [Candidatus Latescibacteria bacterium]|nr:tetratricopeptide repeat protein [Candidatus Latescibacterota bacterium]NIO77161.1 tetratricopeptide repeat protein [Candidatus Latescibacterota bacterium]
MLSEIREFYEAGEYREAVAHCRHALRKDYRDGEVYYYYGLALVHLGRDYEGFRQLDAAVRTEPSLAKPAASTLFSIGKEAHAVGDVEKARGWIGAAVSYYPAIELGPYAFTAGDAFFGDKEFDKAANLYKDAVLGFPDTTAAEQALFRMGVSYAAIGLNSKSKESYEKLVEVFPRGEFTGEAKWRIANLLYEQGAEELERGNFEEVIEVVDKLLTFTGNAALIQKGRFLKGEAYEGLGEFKKAYAEYRAIIRQDRGASGRIVERAQEKMAILREAGLN